MTLREWLSFEAGLGRCAAARAEVTAYEKTHPRDPIGLILVIENREATTDPGL